MLCSIQGLVSLEIRLTELPKNDNHISCLDLTSPFLFFISEIGLNSAGVFQTIALRAPFDPPVLGETACLGFEILL